MNFLVVVWVFRLSREYNTIYTYRRIKSMNIDDRREKRGGGKNVTNAICMTKIDGYLRRLERIWVHVV